jgi:hypothetical protein
MANTVTVPGGSSTVSVPPSSVAAESAWEVIADIELTALSTYNFLTAGTATDSTTISVDGRSVTFNAVGGATALSNFASKFQITAGTGLEITPVANGSTGDYNGSNQIAPRFGPKITDMFPSYDISRDIVACQLYATVTPALSSNYQFFGLTLDSQLAGTGVGDQWQAARAVHSTGIRAVVVRASSGDVSASNPSANPSFFECVVGQRLAAPTSSVSDWSGSWPEPLATLHAPGWNGIRAGSVLKDKEGVVGATSINPTAANGAFSAIAAAPTSSVAFTMVAKKMRFLRLKT